jgi:3-hydroxyisobutyrate dehydrogenase-like beta-hydroxyacid dehydrogenase
MHIGFIGIGKMGAEMVKRLISFEQTVTVYDANVLATQGFEELGAKVANSVATLGSNSDLVILMLPNSPIVEEVLAGSNDEVGLVDSLKKGSIIIDMGSSYYFSTLKLHEQLKEKGIYLVDAPVSGGVIGATAGMLTIMLGSKEQPFDKVLPILNMLGKNVYDLGSVGSGHAVKAINNYLSATSLFATSEAFYLIEKLGIDKEKALDVINNSSGRSFSTELKFPRYILPEAFNSGFSLDLILKDVKTTNRIAKEINLPIQLASIIEKYYLEAKEIGGVQQDHTEISKYYSNKECL